MGAEGRVLGGLFVHGLGAAMRRAACSRGRRERPRGLGSACWVLLVTLVALVRPACDGWTRRAWQPLATQRACMRPHGRRACSMLGPLSIPASLCVCVSDRACCSVIDREPEMRPSLGLRGGGAWTLTPRRESDRGAPMKSNPVCVETRKKLGASSDLRVEPLQPEPLPDRRMSQLHALLLLGSAMHQLRT